MILVLAAETQETLDSQGAAIDNTNCETIVEAKKKAKYYLTEEYMNVCESSTRLQYSQVWVNGDLKYDFFG